MKKMKRLILLTLCCLTLYQYQTTQNTIPTEDEIVTYSHKENNKKD